MRKHLLSTVVTLSAASSFLSQVDAGGVEVTGVNIETLNNEAFKVIQKTPTSTIIANYKGIESSQPGLGSSLLLDLTTTPNLVATLLDTKTSFIKVPHNTLLRFFGDVSLLDLSKIQPATASSKIRLDLSGVTGMDKAYSAIVGSGLSATAGKNAIPKFVSHVSFPSNAKAIALNYGSQFIAPGAKQVYIFAASDTKWTGFPDEIIDAKRDEIYFVGFSEMDKLDVRSMLSTATPTTIKTTAKVSTLVTTPTTATIGAASIQNMNIEVPTGTTSTQATTFLDTMKTSFAPQVALLNQASIDSTVLTAVKADLPDDINIATQTDMALVKERILQKGIDNVKELKLKSSQLSAFFTALNITDFESLEKIEFMNDAGSAYANVTVPATGTHITRSDLPASIKEVYSANAVIIKGAIGGALTLDSKFNAAYVDLSQATGVTALAAGTGFTAASITKLHLPENLDLSVAGTRTFVASLSALTHLSLYGTSDIAALLAANIPTALINLDLSNSSATAALPVLPVTVTTVTTNVAFAITDVFTNFTGASKMLIVKGAAGGVFTVTNLPNVATIDLRDVTGATSFSAALNTDVGHTNLAQLYLPESFDVTAATLTGAGTPMVYFSGAYAAGGGNRILEAGYGARHLNFSGVTGAGLFQVPANILTLTLVSVVGGIAASVAATANAFDLIFQALQMLGYSKCPLIY